MCFLEICWVKNLLMMTQHHVKEKYMYFLDPGFENVTHNGVDLGFELTLGDLH